MIGCWNSVCNGLNAGQIKKNGHIRTPMHRHAQSNHRKSVRLTLDDQLFVHDNRKSANQQQQSPGLEIDQRQR